MIYLKPKLNVVQISRGAPGSAAAMPVGKMMVPGAGNQKQACRAFFGQQAQVSFLRTLNRKETIVDNVLTYVKKAGGELANNVLLLWVILNSPATPAWAKALIVTALTYFLSPLDAIPDVTPVIGFTDDAGVIAACIAQIAGQVTDDHKREVRNRFRKIFG